MMKRYIYTWWFPRSPYEPADAIDDFEYHDDRSRRRRVPEFALFAAVEVKERRREREYRKEKHVTFEYNEYSLRKPRIKDADGFIHISKDPEVMKYYGEGDGICRTIGEAEKQVRWCLEQFERNAGRWIIVEKGKDEYIGDVGFYDFHEKHKRAEIGFRLMKKYWGRGIMTAFIGRLAAWGFEELKYNRIQALVDERNRGSAVVLQRNNFQREGTLREYEFEHGHFVNLDMFSLLRKEIKR